MKRQWSRMVRGMLALSLVFTVGCNGAQETGDGLTLTFWNGFSGPDGKMMDRIVDQFNKENPGVHVRMQIIPWGTYYDKVTLGLAFGGAPDVFILHNGRLAEYASRNVLAPLDDIYGPKGLDEKDFAPVPLQSAAYKGTRYAVPLDCWPLGLYYNVKLFEEAGIVDENGKAKPPKTYEEFIDAAKRLTKNTDGKPGIDQWGFAYAEVGNNSATFLNQYGVTLLTPDLQRSALAEPNAKAAIARMLEIIHKHRVAPNPEGQNSWEAFRMGKIGMVMHGVYVLNDLERQEDLRYAAAPVPQFGPKRAVWGGSHLLCVPQSVKGARREAAKRFIKYLSDHSLQWAKGGQVPVRLSILRSPEFAQMPVQKALSAQLPYVTYEPPSESINLISPFSGRAIEAALFRLQTVDEAMELGAKRMDRVLRRERGE